jgi:DNA-binding CsgD family transcriptional regulator
VPDVAIETTATLLERDRELAELRGALEDAGASRGRLVLIQAPAGLGKTSLLRAASELAADAGFAHLRARAGELERDFAYGCVRQLLEPAAATGADRRFDGAAALSRPLFEPASSPQPDSSFAVLHGLYWLVCNLTEESPVAMLVDDLHWADAESLRFLNYLAPRLDGLPLVVVASARPGEGDTGELARLATAPETTVLRPAPLSVAAAAALCEVRLGEPVAGEFAAACREATGGNPFLLEALLREARDQRLPTDAREAVRVRGIAPAAVAQAVLLRLSARPPAATALVRAAAVLGDGASVAEAARLAGIGEDEAAREADQLVGLGLLTPADGVEFAHAIVREAVYADVGPNERADAHARAAMILADLGAADERTAAQIAEAKPAGDPARAALLRRVAADALARGAPAAAAAWLARALDEPPPPDAEPEVLYELGSAELRLGAAAAVGHLRAAVERFRDPELLATAVSQLANALTIAGRSGEAVAALEAAIEVVEPADRELALLLEAEVATHALQAGLETRGPAERRLERRAGLRGDTPGERVVLASLARQRARASTSEREAVAHLEGALAGGRLLRDQRRDIVGPIYDLLLGLLATDALDLAEACLEPALAEARSRASVPAMAWLTVRGGWISYRRGDVARAEADARTALELLADHGIAVGRPFALGLLVVALIERDEAGLAERELDASGLGEDVPPGITANVLIAARGLLHVARNRPREGYDDLVEYGRRDKLWGAASPLASRWRSPAALALATLGEHDRARALAAEDLERARRWGAASGIGSALRTVALLDGSLDGLREAATALEASPARLEHARALADLGAALRRAGRRTEARAPLEHALELADRCGGRALAALARTELQAAGGRASDPHGRGVEQLTVSERRVAELAAEGRSNPEIAQTLFVTRKTVETHLGHVYRKLDIAGRGELAGALSR